MMEYIHVHKPPQLPTKTTNTPRRKSTSRKSIGKQKKADAILLSNDFYDPTQLAFKLFEKKLDDTKQKIHEDLFNSIYENTFEYFDYYLQRRIACNEGNIHLNLDEDERLIFNPICHVIPTIALFTGINFQDYASLCENLTDKLEEDFSENVFFISEKNANNLKSLANSIFCQWETKNIDMERSFKKNTMFTFKNLFEDIKQAKIDDSPGLSSTIFVFKQFELIPKETVEQFVSLVSCYVETMPIYFIIELASQSNILYEQLSSGVISKLCIKKLYLMSPELYLDKFLTKLFIEQSTMFKLSGDILKLLVDTYYEYNFSISSLIHALKFCYYDHLQTHAYNQLYLTSILDETTLYHSLVEQGAKKDVEERFIYDSLNSSMALYQEDWIKQNNQFALIVQFLFEIVKNFPSEQEEESFFSVNTKSFSDFYVKICSLCRTNKKPFAEMSQYTNLKSLLKITSANTINDIVLALLDLINLKPIENEARYTVEFLNDIHDLEEILLKLKQSFSAQITEVSFNEEDENVLENKKSENSDPFNLEQEMRLMAKPSLIKRKSLRQSRVLGELNSTSASQVQRSMTMPKQRPAVIQKPKPIQYNNKLLTQNMIDWLENQFSIYFNRDYSTQIHNASYFCYTNFEKVQKRLFDMQRINVHSCLFSANDFLNMKINGTLADDSPNKRARNMNANVEVTTNEELVPLSVIYRVYLECGHMINLFDWLQAFVERVTHVDLKELSPTKRKLMQALFFRSITEMQFMGFIKPTNRKVDHVVKLTNGSSLLSVDDHNFQIKLSYH